MYSPSCWQWLREVSECNRSQINCCQGIALVAGRLSQLRVVFHACLQIPANYWSRDSTVGSVTQSGNGEGSTSKLCFGAAANMFQRVQVSISGFC